MFILTFISHLLCASFALASSKVSYYQKIEQSGVHIGYAIIQSELVESTKQKIITTFTKTNDTGGSITESLKAYSHSESLRPISYRYTSLVGERSKTIDAVIRNNVLHATINEGSGPNNRRLNLKDGVFLGSFLVPLLAKRGLEAGAAYEFNFIDEETFRLEKGRLHIRKTTKVDSNQTFEILNDFKQQRFYSYIDKNGRIIKTKNPVSKLTTKKTSKSDAVGEIAFPEGIIKTLFGEIPKDN